MFELNYFCLNKLQKNIKNIKINVLKGKNKNDAGVLTLLHLIAKVYDTNLYKRGGVEGVFFAQDCARKLLLSGDPTVETVRKMDAELTERNLSPGGCADLLAVTYFLTELEESLF